MNEREQKNLSIRELLKRLPKGDQPPLNISVEAEGPLTAQQLTAAVIEAINGFGGEENRLPSHGKIKTLHILGSMPEHILTRERGGADDTSDLSDWDDDTTDDMFLLDLADYGAGRNEVTINRDPFEQFKFAEKLIDYQGELLEICWALGEKLEQAREYVSGTAAWPALIDRGVEVTAQLQKIADRIRDVGVFEKKHAAYLIQQMEQFNK